MKNIILIGMPASGKSTVGIVIAKRLGYDFIDSDLLIQSQEKRLLKDIIKEEGIDGFLEIENRVNKKIQNKIICRLSLWSFGSCQRKQMIWEIRQSSCIF